MKLKCIQNYKSGFFGYDYRKLLTISKHYTIVAGSTTPKVVYVYTDQNKWHHALLIQFVPVEK